MIDPLALSWRSVERVQGIEVRSHADAWVIVRDPTVGWRLYRSYPDRMECGGEYHSLEQAMVAAQRFVNDEHDRAVARAHAAAGIP